MKEENNIDRLFQESFKDFEVEAPKNAWGNIENRLSNKSKTPVFPLWQKIGAAAAVIAVLIIAGSQWLIGIQVSNTNNSIVDTPKENKQPSSEIFVIPSDDEAGPQNNQDNAVAETISDEKPSTSVNISQPSRLSPLQNRSTLRTNGQMPNTSSAQALNRQTSANKNNRISSSNSNIVELRPFITSKPLVMTKNHLNPSDLVLDRTTTISAPKTQSLVKVAQQLYEDKNTKNTSTEKKSWFIKPQISPTFYGNLGEGSAIDDNLAQNASQGQVNMAYGVNVAYQINDKIKVRSGVNRVNLNYSTSDIFLIAGAGYSSFNNADLNTGFQSSLLTSQQLDNLIPEGITARIPSETSELQQQLGYIEIPMELEYKLLDKAININVIGGASTLLLNNNSLEVQTGNISTPIGEANNLNDISFSTNFALGFDYDISERLMLNLEPTFKYQINTFQSGTTDFQPYFFGVYSGVIFKF